MEGNNMQNEKKELLRTFNTVVKDLLDNYEEYTDAEKEQVKEVFKKVAELNTILDKYDVDVKFDWEEYLAACSQCLDLMVY
jgi:hypothetical protein